jgi:hypothetical protein
MKNETIKTEVKKKVGRPIVEGSKRQIELQMKSELRSKGLIKRGRPIKEDSKRQSELKRKTELKSKGILNGLKGRPINPNSKKQLEQKRKDEARANGTLKVGRPKVKKTEVGA